MPNTKEYLKAHCELGETISLALEEAKDLFEKGAGISKVVSDLQDAEAVMVQRAKEIKAQLVEEQQREAEARKQSPPPPPPPPPGDPTGEGGNKDEPPK